MILFHRDYNEDACLAYNVTSLSSAAATNNTYYSEIKCKEGDKTEYSQVYTTLVIINIILVNKV